MELNKPIKKISSFLITVAAPFFFFGEIAAPIQTHPSIFEVTRHFVIIPSILAETALSVKSNIYGGTVGYGDLRVSKPVSPNKLKDGCSDMGLFAITVTINVWPWITLVGKKS